MCARAGQLRAEGCCACANGNLVLRSPQDSLVIVAALRYILKGHYFCLGRGASGNPPQEGHSLCAGTNAVRHEDCLDGMILRNILEGVGFHRAYTLAIYQHLGYFVALVRGDGEGLIPSVTDGDPFGGRDRAVRIRACLDGMIGAAAAAATTAAGIRPVGVHDGVFMEFSIGCDHRAAACRGVPAVKAVSAAVGGFGQLGQLLVNGFHAVNGGRAAIAIEGDGVLLRMIAVAFRQNDNLRKIAIQLPHTVDILQGEGIVGGCPQTLYIRAFCRCPHYTCSGKRAD